MIRDDRARLGVQAETGATSIDIRRQAGCDDHSAQGEFVAALRRRRAAAARCPELDDGHRDPHHDDRARAVPTPREVESWRAAWAHLHALGYAVDVPAPVIAAARTEPTT